MDRYLVESWRDAAIVSGADVSSQRLVALCDVILNDWPDGADGEWRMLAERNRDVAARWKTLASEQALCVERLTSALRTLQELLETIQQVPEPVLNVALSEGTRTSLSEALGMAQTLLKES